MNRESFSLRRKKPFLSFQSGCEIGARPSRMDGWSRVRLSLSLSLHEPTDEEKKKMIPAREHLINLARPTVFFSFEIGNTKLQ